ncbi:hypothetical protein LUQ84_002749 [Hamiltosporidium tvaerminnensis]|nr:hypothetical protein LUQ84_002749 [Hamiltosporidium tvaerminnensis]
MARSYMFENKTVEARRKQREEQQVELRQQRREDLLNKKRSMVSKDTAPQIANLKEMKSKVLSNDPNIVFQGVFEFRTVLSVEKSPPIQAVIDSGLVPRFVELLSTSCNIYQDPSTDLTTNTRLESAWVLTNISSGTTEQTSHVVDCGAIPLLLEMINEPSSELIDQGIWALGNIAGDSEAMRDSIINSNATPTILSFISDLLHSKDHLKILRNATWLLSNLNRGRNPPPPLPHMKSCIPVISLLTTHTDPEVVTDSFWAASYVCDADISTTDLILSTEIPNRAILLLKNIINKLSNTDSTSSYNDNSLYKIAMHSISPVIRMLGNILTGTDEQTNYLLDMEILTIFKDLLILYQEPSKQSRLRKEICWSISNITAGTEKQVERVFESKIIPILIDILNYSELYVRIEACYAITNSLSYCNTRYEHLEILLENNFLESLKDLLMVVSNLVEVQVNILNGFKMALEGCRAKYKKYGNNPVANRMEEIGLVGVIEELQDSGDASVSDKAYNIIVEYFNGEEI